MEQQQTGFFRAYANYWIGYANFSGRTSVQGFWKAYFFVMLIRLIYTVITVILVRQLFGDIMPSILDATINGTDPYAVSNSLYGMPSYQAFLNQILPFEIYSYVTILPTLALMTRRLRDSGQSPWWTIALFLIPVAGFIMTFVMLRRPSVPGLPPYGQGASPFGKLYGQPPYDHGAAPYGQPRGQAPYGAPPQPPQGRDAPYTQPAQMPARPPDYGVLPYGVPGFPAASVRCAAAILTLWLWIASLLAVFVGVGILTNDAINAMTNSGLYQNGVLNPNSPGGLGPYAPGGLGGSGASGGSGVSGGSGGSGSAAAPVKPGDWKANLSADELQTVRNVQNAHIEGYDTLTIGEVVSATAKDLSWYTFTYADTVSVTVKGVTGQGDDLYAEFQLNQDGTVMVYNVTVGSKDVYNDQAQELYAEWYRAALAAS